MWEGLYPRQCVGRTTRSLSADETQVFWPMRHSTPLGSNTMNSRMPQG